METILSKIELLNEGNPLPLNEAKGYLFTVSPSTAKKSRGYYTKEQVKLTEYEKKMPGVVIGQNRGMIFSSCRPVVGKHIIPELGDINFIIVNEVSRKLFPIDDAENKIAWIGKGEHAIKDVIGDGQGQHFFCTNDGHLATDLWLKPAEFGYGVKGMLGPGLATDIGVKVIDIWGVERTITLGNTLVLNTSLVKGVGAYDSLEDFIAHGEQWGLTTLMKQWQSGDHKPEMKRIIGTQPNSTNLTLTRQEIEELLKPESRKIWTKKFEKIAWMANANIKTTRGRAFAARPELIYKDVVMNQIDVQASTNFLRIAKGQVKVEAQYLKMFQDKLVWSLVYIHGMDPNEAAKKAAETGLHGEIRVNPAFAGHTIVKDENSKTHVEYKKETFLDNKGRYIETALVRYPHGAPSETIIVKAYLDSTVPVDVVIFPAPVANDDGTISVKTLYAFRLQGADYDGDAVTAFTNKIWLEAQKRNIGKPYMIIPINTESTEKDKTLVTDETWEAFCQMKVMSLSNQVGLIATSLKYFLSQKADMIRSGKDVQIVTDMITSHACAMGDDIDEFKHGKSKNTLRPFVIPGVNGLDDEVLHSPYFVRYAKKYKSQEEFDKAVYNKNGSEKKPGTGILDMYATSAEKLMNMCGLPVKAEVAKVSDGKDRYYFGVHPVQWKAKEIDLFVAEHGEGQLSVALPVELERAYNVPHGTVFSVKKLFQLLYKDHSATCNSLINCDQDDPDRDRLIKSVTRINERYVLAKVAIVAWTKAMKFARTGENISAEEAMKLFTTLMTQHTSKARSVIDVMTRTGTFVNADGEKYEKTIFTAARTFNYFLDVCGDGLLLQKEEAPNFPEVSDAIIAAAEVEMPDLEKAKQKALKELALIDRIVETLNIDQISEIVEEENAELCDEDIWVSSEDFDACFDF